MKKGDFYVSKKIVAKLEDVYLRIFIIKLKTTAS